LIILLFTVNTNVQTAMTVIYALAGAVGLILFILFVVCVSQKVCTYKSTEADFEGETVTEHMLTPAPTMTSEVEPSVIYRPSNGYSKVQEVYNPPRYSELEANDPLGGGAVPAVVPSAPVAAAAEDNRRITQPPTYDEVIQEKMTES
jgi:hypothetical protein